LPHERHVVVDDEDADSGGVDQIPQGDAEFGGLAEYFGFDVTLTRVIVAVAAFFAFPVICIIYVCLGLLLPVRANEGPVPRHNDPVERQVRSSPHDTLANVRYRFRDLDVRLQRLEKFVTSNRYTLEREFRKLEE